MLEETYNKYNALTNKTAVYPKEHEVSYLALGINAEFGEFGNAETIQDAIKELGDIYWFVSQLSHLTGKSMWDLRNSYPGPNPEGEKWNTPQGDGFALAVMSMEIMDVHDAVAKFLRDETDYTEKLSFFLTRTILVLESIADVLGLDIGELLEENIKKLESRQRRGKLHGSGDNR